MDVLGSLPDPLPAVLRGGPSRLWARYLRWLPVPVYLGLFLALDGRDTASFEPRFLLPSLNIVFLTGVSLLIARLAARSYLLGESLSVLLLGCGMLAFGVSSAFAAATVLYRMEADTTVTVHNAGAFVAAAFGLASAFRAAWPASSERVIRRSSATVVVAYTAIVVAIALVAVAEFDGFLPDFFTPSGPTLLRQVMLGSAVAMMVLSAVLFRVLGSRSPAAFISWYSLGLLLIAMGLAGVFSQQAVGSALSWLGRTAQYIGCVYMYVAVVSLAGEVRPWRIPLDQILRETRDRYRSLVDLSPDAILVHTGGRYVFANPAATRLFGAGSSEAIVGRQVLDFVPPEEREAVRQRIEVVRAGRVIPFRETRVVRLDGSMADVETTGTPVEFRGERAVLLVMREITERKRIEEALQAGERKLRERNAVLEGINRIFREALACDSEADLGRICLAVAEDVTGSTFGFIAEIAADGTHLDDIAVSDPGWAACRMGDRTPASPQGFPIHGLYGRVLLDGKAFFTNDPAAHPDSVGVPEGHPRLTSFLGAPLMHDGRTIGLVGLGNREGGYRDEDLDAAEALAPAIVQVFMRERAERALSEANRRKSEFLATLSHELRNPLAPMRYALELLGRDETAPAAKRVIERQLAHLVRLVDDLLDVTRIESNKISLRRQPVDIAAIVRTAMEAASPEIRRAAHRFSLTLPAEPLTLDADPDRLAQVVTNLLNNAARYTPREGQIELTVRPDGDRVAIIVRDSGIGLSPDDCVRVFDMFTQIGEPGEGGLGIGLALVKGVVELHGGTVEARSDGPGRGSEFVVRLPRTAEPAPRANADVTASSASPALRILVVDDNVDAATMLQHLLGMCGHEVRVAHDGHSALAVLSEFQPDVGLFDIGLPGMDGYELASRVRALPGARSMYLVAFTGWGQESDRQRAREAGFDAHLTKPADPEQLNRALASAVRRAGDGAAT